MPVQDPDTRLTSDELVARIGAKNLSDARLAELRARIFPVVRAGAGGALVGVATAGQDPRTTAFGFSDAPRFNPGRLVEVGRVIAYHTCAYHGFFKPSEAECLAQIPESYLSRIVAYGGWDTDEIAIVAGGSGHRAPMRLYARELPA